MELKTGMIRQIVKDLDKAGVGDDRVIYINEDFADTASHKECNCDHKPSTMDEAIETGMVRYSNGNPAYDTNIYGVANNEIQYNNGYNETLMSDRMKALAHNARLLNAQLAADIGDAAEKMAYNVLEQATQIALNAVNVKSEEVYIDMCHIIDNKEK